MSDVAIRVENMGKRYRLGQTVGYKTLRDTLANVMVAPFRRRRTISREPSSTSNEPQATKHKSDYIWALKNVSFEVRHGEAVGIIGRNGSGKSTLLKVLSKITTPTEGYAEIYGRVGSLLEVGTGFHPELTGRENIYLNGAILGLKKAEIEQKFDEIVTFSEIEQFLDTPVKRYSSGMYVRLAFAIAAHLEPDILLVDEVLAVGDIQFQKKCLGKMEGVAREGRTVLFVSHNMATVQELCPRAILLRDGQLAGDGSSPKVISDYLSVESGLSSGDMDVSDPSLRRNSLPDSRFRWMRVTTLNSAGKATAMLALGEPFEIILDGIAESEISDVRAGFAINSAFGMTMLSSFQTDQGLPSHLPAGKIRFHIKMNPNFLAPGLYDIGLGANGSGVTDWLPTTLQFTVSAISKDADASRSYHSGVINYPYKWHMEFGH
jgi:lipopolysaccharide transport system ATP-binding protein